jgi:hypothetical protein
MCRSSFLYTPGTVSLTDGTAPSRAAPDEVPRPSWAPQPQSRGCRIQSLQNMLNHQALRAQLPPPPHGCAGNLRRWNSMLRYLSWTQLRCFYLCTLSSMVQIRSVFWKVLITSKIGSFYMRNMPSVACSLNGSCDIQNLGHLEVQMVLGPCLHSFLVPKSQTRTGKASHEHCFVVAWPKTISGPL